VFEFRGTDAFDPSGNPELRLFETGTGSTLVQIDNNGDGVIDAEIRVGGVTGLTADDFVL
jgi:serralysin